MDALIWMKAYSMFLAIPAQRAMCLLLCVWFGPSFEMPLVAEEYSVRGIVISILCDTDGKPRNGEIAPGLSSSNACEFVWFRKGEKWRLNIKEPTPPFTEGVWKSIMPFTESNLIFITSCPNGIGDSKAEGNAIVKVATNRFLTAESVYGAHAVWLSHNLDQILTMIGPSKRCPPFLDSDSAIRELEVNTHEIRKTNGSVVFWNLGRYFARDSNQNVVFEAGQPKLLPYPVIAETGFMEFQLRSSDGFLDELRQIPEYTELTYWVPFRDETKPNGVRMAMLSKLIVKNQSVDVRLVSDAIFLPAWTNSFATVFDFRETVSNNQPLFSITKAKTITPGTDELLKRKQFDEQVRTAARISRRSSERPTTLLPGLLLLAVFCTLPLGLWLILRKSGRGN